MNKLSPILHKKTATKFPKAPQISKLPMMSLFSKANATSDQANNIKMELDRSLLVHNNDVSRFSSATKEKDATPKKLREANSTALPKPHRQSFLNVSGIQSIHSILNEFDSEVKKEKLQGNKEDDTVINNTAPKIPQERKSIKLTMPQSLDTSPMKLNTQYRSLSPLRFTHSSSLTERTREPKAKKELVLTAFRPKIRSYPSNSLILQGKMKNLMGKLENNEEVSPEEFREVENMVDKISEETAEAETLKEYAVYAYSDEEYECSPWHPTPRELPTLTSFDNFVVLYGGSYPSVNEELAIFEIHKSRWFVPPVSGIKPIYQDRIGHSACAFGDQLLIFGGERLLDRHTDFRLHLNDLIVFSIRDFSFDSLLYKCYNERIIEPRKFHAAAVSTQKMYIYGGMDVDSKCLSDLWELDLSTHLFICVLDADELAPKGIFSHRMCFVHDKYKTGLTEGLYVFGGKDSKGKINNILKFLDVDKPTAWRIPETKGEPPVARYSHSLEVYLAQNLLLVYGGKNDTIYKSSGTQEVDDFKALDLLQMTWIKIKVDGEKLNSRHSHGSCLFDEPRNIRNLARGGHFRKIDLRKNALTTPTVPLITKEKLSELQNLSHCSLMPQRWKQFEMTVGNYRESPSYLPVPKPIFIEKLSSNAKTFRRSESVLNAKVDTEPPSSHRDSARKKTSNNVIRNAELRNLRDLIKKQK